MGTLYRVEMVATFTVTISENLRGPAALGASQIEELIDRNWWWISGSTDVLLESNWELESFEELPAEPD